MGLQKAISEIAEMKELDLNDKLQDDLSVLTREIEVMQERIKGRQDVLKKVQGRAVLHRGLHIYEAKGSD